MFYNEYEDESDSHIVGGERDEPFVMEHDSELGWRCRTLTGKVSPWDYSNCFSEIFDEAVKEGKYVPYEGELAEVAE